MDVLVLYHEFMEPYTLKGRNFLADYLN